MKRYLLAATLFVVVGCTLCLSQKQAERAQNSLAKPVDWGVFAARLFSDSSRLTFTLATSWIPGENHKGMMRYKMTARREDSETPGGPSSTDPIAERDAKEELLKRAHSCLIELNLYDKDDFLLRKIVVPFGFGVDDRAQVQSLYANSSVQMDAKEYREFIGNPTGGGSWNVSWACEPR